MMRHATLDQLAELKLHGMARAFEEQLSMSDVDELSFEERLGLLVERELTARASRQLTARLRRAKLREQAALEDIDWRAQRGLDKGQLLRLASCRWIADHLNVLITGKAGVGKTFLACALGHKACREGYTVAYLRIPRLFRSLAVARGDGSYEKLLSSDTKSHEVGVHLVLRPLFTISVPLCGSRSGAKAASAIYEACGLATQAGGPRAVALSVPALFPPRPSSSGLWWVWETSAFSKGLWESSVCGRFPRRGGRAVGGGP